MQNTKMKILYKNRKAYHNYFIEDEYEAGIVLTGGEVKSCRSGHIDLSEGYITIDNGQLILHNMFISQYNNCGYIKFEEKRLRKLLMHKKEILKLFQQVNVKGFTLVPLSLYLNKGRIKLCVGLAKGKHTYDKRNVLKDKEINKEIQQYI